MTVARMPLDGKGFPSHAPGQAWEVTVDRPCTVYVFVMNRGVPQLPEWKRTALSVSWRGEDGNQTYEDSVYQREFPAGIVSVPAHAWKDDNNSFGVPHACVVVPKTADADSEKSLGETK